jgi:site-specific recombinase XerD
MRNAKVLREGPGGIQTWIEARLSEAYRVRDVPDAQCGVEAGGAPPSDSDGMRQLDFFDGQPIAVRSAPDTTRSHETSASDLDGSRGRFRGARPDCLLYADNDYEAIQAWVRTKGAADGGEGQSHTQRAYLKEAERLLLWAIVERRKALSSLTHEDCLEYVSFLAHPTPACRWCGPRSASRWSGAWRPFEGALSPTARRQAVVILNNLFTFLQGKGYLLGNAMAGIRSPRGSEPKIDTGRSFTQRQWAMVEANLADMEPSADRQRLGFTLHLLYCTGLRLSEVVDAKLGDLEQVELAGNKVAGADAQAWMLAVRGKGGRIREVPVPAELMAELSLYLAARALHPNVRATANRSVPLIARLRCQPPGGDGAALEPIRAQPSTRLSQSALYKMLKAFFANVASSLRARGDDADADRFDRASTHWLRHTHASHSIAHGVPIEVAQQNLGHSSLATTPA